ncbi:Cytoplasmic FMR1-interacting [Carpediemonas membranifera]|uniref:Cytoplasmic FMR1-interacting n=1 Tax=Carpediemonas membranifera TaxID=201153 RepID=A0A8J6B242_9EUKA|nr:Cytoplasmic FMR1-interacting [Carpediemonas membranifera]|eukprot:KAG9391259.1 Cytoplasmic FMR1-interacting [Carpediemonas membranifera]
MDAYDTQTMRVFKEADAFQIEKIVELQKVIAEGHQRTDDLYGYRLCANTIPQITPSDPRKLELYKLTVKVLEPRIAIIRNLLQFVADGTHVFTRIIGDMCQMDRVSIQWSPTLLQALCTAIDIFGTIDLIKNSKAAINNDWSAYNRAYQAVKVAEIQSADADALTIENETLMAFLRTQDHVSSLIRDKLASIDGVDTVLLALVHHCVRHIKEDLYILPSDRFLAVRCLARVPTLMTGDAMKESKLSDAWAIMKQHPYTPLFGDLTISASDVLSRIPNFNSAKRGLPSIDTARGSAMFDRIAQAYDLGARRPQISAQFGAVMASLSSAVIARQDDPHATYDAVSVAARHIGSWTSAVLRLASFKFAFPATDPELEAKGVPVDDKLSAYDRAVRFNYGPDEKKALMAIIGYISAAGSRLRALLPAVAPLVQRHLFSSFQTVIQHDLTGLAQLLEKDRKGAVLARRIMSHVDICGDWVHGKVTDGAAVDLPEKAALPPTVYTEQIRVLVADILSPSHRKLVGKHESVKTGSLQRWLDISSSFASTVHELDGLIQSASDIGHLWLREMYLSIERRIQFPTVSSLPFMLASLACSGKQETAPLVGLLHVPMKIYDDAANLTLRRLKQRHLYEELEAEANLCLGQIIIILSDMVVARVVSRSAVSHIDPVYLGRYGLEKLATSKRGAVRFEPPAADFAQLFGQPPLQLMGRSVSIALHVGRQTTRTLKEELVTMLREYSGSSLDQSHELADQLSILLGACDNAAALDLPVPSGEALLAADTDGLLATAVMSAITSLDDLRWSAGHQCFRPIAHTFDQATAALVPQPAAAAKPVFVLRALTPALAEVLGSVWGGRRTSVGVHQMIGILRHLSAIELRRLVASLGNMTVEAAGEAAGGVDWAAPASALNRMASASFAANCLIAARMIDVVLASSGRDPMAWAHVHTAVAPRLAQLDMAGLLAGLDVQLGTATVREMVGDSIEQALH